MEYRHVDTAAQKQMLDQRAAQLEQEHFNHQINIDSLKSLAPPKDSKEAAQIQQAIREAQKAQATIEAAHDACCAKIDELDIVLAKEAPADDTADA